MAKYLAQLVVSGARILGRAFTQALKEEYATSQQAARARRNQSFSDNDNHRTFDQITGISLEEAKQILNIKEIHDEEALLKSYNHLFHVNAKEKGGSLYLQSKVFRAKERIDEELRYEKNSKESKPDSEKTATM
ncbi:hypothetical protein P879_01290 [Paragonimus westermani]|uniref:Mitochondrial import inner membrane translocase subunit TIM16 n=1 Tax=Paragonimus westermani TaxID=34504 RepID=A0A8T0DT35_9TREM|nr:hypothetical protein P879_01290 [Paragonimus westermani]